MTKLPTRFASTALLLLPAAAFAQTTGVSHPEDLNDTISTTPVQTSHYQKPSPSVPVAAVPVSAVPVSAVPVSPVQEPAPVREPGPAEPVLVQRVTAPSTETAPVMTETPAAAPVVSAQLVHRNPELDTRIDPDSSIVVEVPSARNELPAGTLLHAELTHEVSTVSTQPGDVFTARLTQPLVRRGEVLVPAGSLVTGRVADVHAGSRLHGGAAIQLLPEFVTLPDGAKHHLSAQVVDLPYIKDAHVNDEGVIRGRMNLKATATGVGLTTASATVAGAVVGGGVGAAVGAAVGIGVATVWYLRHEQEQTLPEKTEVVFSLDRAMKVGTVER